MNKLLAATCLVAFAALADGQTVWRFEKADADAAGGPGAVGYGFEVKGDSVVIFRKGGAAKK